jgi:hypothetical protein
MPTQYGPDAMGSVRAGNVIAGRQYVPDNTDRLGLQLREFRAIANAGALIGRATAEFTGGLVISDIGVFAKDGRLWAQLPAEPQRDRDGQILKDDRGKAKYRSALRWRDRGLQDQFSHQLIEAIERQYGPLEGEP